jgi:hypothetical protein
MLEAGSDSSRHAVTQPEMITGLLLGPVGAKVGQWSWASSDRLTGWPVWSLCQMAAVRARMRRRTRTVTRPGAAPVAFEVKLALERGVDRSS